MTSQRAGRTTTSGTVWRRGRELGWLSLGLGVAQIVAANRVRRLSGVDDSNTSRAVVRLVGARELVHAAGLLTSRRKGRWVWIRVAGDAMDLAALGLAMARRSGWRRRRLLGVTGAVAGITVMDVRTAIEETRIEQQQGGLVELAATVTIGVPAREVYEFWRRLENLPTFMAHLEEVRITGDRTSHWRAAAPFDSTIEWDAEITEDVPGERIGWRSTGDAAVPNTGTVHFLPAPDGVSTEVHVRMAYDIAGGRLGEAVARYFGEQPHQQVWDDLRRFKQVMETGEVIRSDGAPWGKRSGKEFPQRPAQPLSPEELAKGAPA